MTSKNLPLVSVIVPSKNEEKNIGNCLESINLQTYPKDKIETIVVVNEDSIDKTKEIARKFTKNVFIKGRERSEPRNFGMLKKASGKYIIYLDADMILSATVVEKTVNMFNEGNLVALYIPEVVLGNSYWGMVRRFERSFYDGTVVDCVRAIKKDIFQKTNGFDVNLVGPEDWDLDKKIRLLGKAEVLDQYNFYEINKKLFKLKYGSDMVCQLSKLTTKGLIFHNEASFNIRKYFQKKLYYSKSFNRYISKWGKDDQDVKKQFGFKYRYLEVFFENGKWKKVINYPVLSLGVICLRILIGISYLVSKINN